MKKIKKFLFLLTTTVIKQVIAVLDFPKDIDDFITYANSIHNSMKNSSNFTSLAAKLATMLINIGSLQTIETATKTKPPTKTVSDRNGALVIVQNNLRELRGDVQTIANADIPNAEAIIISAGMKVKKQGAINKQDFTVKNGEISGTMELTAKGIETRGAHDWGRSNDGTNWVSLTPTLAATTLDTGLTRGAMVEYRHREILKDGPTDWIYSEEIVVQ
ncbi:MAG: hypothetical protein ABI855_18100 [Bacteroidota bacterium]